MSSLRTLRLRPWNLIWTAVIISYGGLAAYASTIQLAENKREQARSERTQPAAPDKPEPAESHPNTDSLTEIGDSPQSRRQHSDGKDVVPLEGGDPYEEGSTNPDGILSQGDIDDSGDLDEDQTRRPFWPYLWNFLEIPNGYSTPIILPGNGASGSGSGFSSRASVPPRRADSPPSS